MNKKADRGRPHHHHSNFSVTIAQIFETRARITRIDVYYEVHKILIKHMVDPEMNCPNDLIIKEKHFLV